MTITIEAERLAGILLRQSTRIVFAESCTAGLATALLAGVPGISKSLCGSFVTYQDTCKQAWLDVPEDLIKTHTAVSAEVSWAMAQAALEHTESAEISAAITGHLGPDAPTDRDGVCFIALARRRNQDIDVVYEKRITLAPPGRVERQAAASRQLLLALADYLDHNSTD